MVGYSIITKPEGCCCAGCCSVMGWDKPKQFLIIHERNFMENYPRIIKEIEIPSYNEREKYILEEGLTLEDNYNKLLTPQEDWTI
jgi:hypothetical protein